MNLDAILDRIHAAHPGLARLELATGTDGRTMQLKFRRSDPFRQSTVTVCANTSGMSDNEIAAWAISEIKSA